jgi:hypothetical protein
MDNKIKSFDGFINESNDSSRMDLPLPNEVESLSEFREIKRIFPNVRLYGGGKQPLEFGGANTNYGLKFSRTGAIYYGGYPVGNFTQIDNESLEFCKDYLISKSLSISMSTLSSVINGKTPITDKVLDEQWKTLRSYKFEIFKKGILERIKDFSSTIKYYNNTPFDTSYELVPELKKIVKEGIEKLPVKEIKEGDLTTEQKNYLRNSISRQTELGYGYSPENKGKPKYVLDKKTGLVDVYGDFDGGYYSDGVKGDLNFMGIKFGKINGDFDVNPEKALPERNLSGFPSEVKGYFRLYDQGSIKSLEGIPLYVGKGVEINGTDIKDFSILDKIDLLDKKLNLMGNPGLKSLLDIKLPERLKELNVSETPLVSLEGCPNEVGQLKAINTKIENLKGCPKKVKEINVSSKNLKDVSEVLKVESKFRFEFRSDSSSYEISLNFPMNKDSREFEKILKILQSPSYAERDKNMLLALTGELMYDYFEENPLELFRLDDFPDMKKDVIQKRNIPDVGKLGKILNQGFL